MILNRCGCCNKIMLKEAEGRVCKKCIAKLNKLNSVYKSIEKDTENKALDKEYVLKKVNEIVVNLGIFKGISTSINLEEYLNLFKNLEYRHCKLDCEAIDIDGHDVESNIENIATKENDIKIEKNNKKSVESTIELEKDNKITIEFSENYEFGNTECNENNEEYSSEVGMIKERVEVPIEIDKKEENIIDCNSKTQEEHQKLKYDELHKESVVNDDKEINMELLNIKIDEKIKESAMKLNEINEESNIEVGKNFMEQTKKLNIEIAKEESINENKEVAIESESIDIPSKNDENSVEVNIARESLKISIVSEKVEEDNNIKDNDMKQGLQKPIESKMEESKVECDKKHEEELIKIEQEKIKEELRKKRMMELIESNNMFNNSFFIEEENLGVFKETEEEVLNTNKISNNVNMEDEVEKENNQTVCSNKSEEENYEICDEETMMELVRSNNMFNNNIFIKQGNLLKTEQEKIKEEIRKKKMMELVESNNMFNNSLFIKEGK